MKTKHRHHHSVGPDGHRHEGTSTPPQDEAHESEADKVAQKRLRMRVVRFVDVFGFADFLCAALVAVATVLLQFHWSYPGLHPAHWESAALASLVRPPEGPVQCLWAAFASQCCLQLGIDQGLAVLKICGHVAVGLLAWMVYYFLRFAFAQRFAMPPEELSPCVGRLRLVTVVGAFLFSFSDFVWRHGQFFTADLFHILIASLALACFIAFQKRGRLAWHGFAYVFAGILSAETPIGILMAIAFFAVNIFNRVRGMRPFRTELLDRDPSADEFDDGSRISDIDDEIVREDRQVASSLENWSFCVFYFMSFLGALLADAWFFRRLGGMGVKHLGNWDYPMILVSSWIGSVRNTISVDDFLIASAMTLLPFLVAFLLLPLATNGKSTMAFPIGWLIAMLGLGAETQLGPWYPLWYWTWSGRETSVMPGAVQTLMAFFGAAAVTGALLVLACASRRHVLGVDTLLVKESWLHARLRQFGSLVVIVIALTLLATSALGRRQPYLRAWLMALNDYVRLQVSHASDVRWLFTDGSFDDALRVAFRSVGVPTRPISVMSGHQPYETYLRSIEAQDMEDIPMLEASGSEALRFWVSEKPAHLANSAAQIGYKTLNKAKEKRPQAAGTAMRVVRTPEDLVAYGKANVVTRAFSKSIAVLTNLKLGATGGFDRIVNEKVDFMLWRLARMSDQRARICSNTGDTKGAVADADITSDLDKANRSLKVLAGKLERLRPTEGVVLTPREGLHIALRRADFELARRYAEMVMRVDEGDEQANFATAMWALEAHDYQKAARHFELAIKRNPNDPALFNNAALAYLKAGFFTDAEIHAETALKLKPDSDVTKRMLEEIKKAMAGSGNEKPDDKKSDDKKPDDKKPDDKKSDEAASDADWK